MKLLAYCGGGAFGEVFYCEDKSGMKMAVKIINKSRMNGQCLRELKGITNYHRIPLNIPNLLQIYNEGDDKDTFYYIMEAADSLSNKKYKADTLASRLSVGPIPDADLYPILSGIFQGIKSLHKAGFAHRDIKPDNILFVNGIPKLADMGLISSLSMTLSTIAGTFIFIPPEIRSADNWDKCDSKLRKRCDLYAFGKLIYCAVTGQAPESFPSLPTSLKFTPSVKCFINLSLMLCEKDTDKRVVSLNKIESELSALYRILNHKARWWDKKWDDKDVNIDKTSLSKRFMRWCFKHWIISCIVLIALTVLVIMDCNTSGGKTSLFLGGAFLALCVCIALILTILKKIWYFIKRILDNLTE